MRRGPAILLLFLLLFGAAYGAWWAGQEGVDRLTGFSPSHFTAEPSTTGSTPLAGRLVLVMIDGLRAEEASLLPSLEWVRQRGASYRLTVPGPSYQPSAAATLLTGAPPDIHGVVHPTIDRSLSSDHLLQSALRTQVKTGGAGSPQLGRLVAGTTGTWYEGNSVTELKGGIEALLKPDGPRLVLIQLEDLLTAMRETETADTGHADYRDALAQLDAHLVEIFDQIDWNSTAVMITGSTPLDQRGSRQEGGEVPLLAAGMGVQPGARGDASLLSVAPTAAALLGLPTPLAAQGEPVLGMLRSEGRPADAIMQSHLAARQTYTADLLRSLGSELTPPAPPATAAESDGYLAELGQQVKEARFLQGQADILERLPYLGGGLLLLLLYLIIVYRQPFGGVVLMSHLLFVLTFHSLFFLLGGSYGPNLSGLDLPLKSLLIRYGLIIGAAMLLATTGAGLLLSRKEFRRPSYLTTTALHLNLSLVAALALPVLAAVLLLGWEFPVALPAAGLRIWFFLTVLQVMVIGALSPLWVWTTVRAVRLGRQLWPPREVGDPVVNADKVVRLKALRRSNRVRG